MNQNSTIKTNKFNLFFRTTFLPENKKVKNIYNSFFYLIVALLFLFAILLLVIVYSLNLNIDNFIKDLDTSIKIKLFGDIQKYSEWTSNSSLNYSNGTSSTGNGNGAMNVVTIGGAVSLSTVLGLSTILSASLAMGFVSVIFSLITIIFKKRTIVSFISLGISFALFVVVLSLFAFLLVESSDYIKNFNMYGKAITDAINKDVSSGNGTGNNFTATTDAFNKMKTFLESLNK